MKSLCTNFPATTTARRSSAPLFHAFVCATLLSVLLLVGLRHAAAAPTLQQPYTVSVDVTSRSWIEATVDGEQSYYGIMEAGRQESWTGEQITILIGNAGGVEVTVDGQRLGRLGAPGQVITLRWPEDTGRFPVQGSATPQPSPTPSPTATQLQTSTPSPTLTPSPTSTATRQATATETVAATSTVTVTPSVIESPSATVTASVTATVEITGSVEITRQAATYIVQPGDTLGQIAIAYNIDVETLQAANDLPDPNVISVGWTLLIPASDGTLPAGVTSSTAPPIQARGTITERMTLFAQQMSPDSPFYNQTWLTYYGRPNVPVMGILGEFDVDELALRLEEQVKAYDLANGPELTVKPAFHLVYGMATKAPGDGSYLGFLDDETVMTYISKAKELDYAVILDVQIGALTPAQSISPALAYLAHENVHLAIDPEFAMVRPGQQWPGDPIGFVTAESVNETQAVIQQYMEENGIVGPRVLLVHQFQDNMIINKEQLDPTYPGVALTLSVDGWGGPWGKIGKYNILVNEDSPFVAFKLFYRWDEPLLSEAQSLGVEAYPNLGYMEITPNLIIYQ